MKNNERRSRISRTFVASVATPLSSHSPRVAYFSKIQVNVKLLETLELDDEMKRRSDRSYTARRFPLSKRLQQLSKTRRTFRRPEQKSQDRTNRVKRRASLHETAGDEVYEMEIANINKTISGTRLGALSALHILQQMQKEQRQSNIFNGYEQIVKRLESQMLEVRPLQQNLSQKKKQELLLRQSTLLQGGRSIEKKMETIYGGEDTFLDKYRQYQISLLEKIPSYRSKHLTLDYKNQWRI